MAFNRSNYIDAPSAPPCNTGAISGPTCYSIKSLVCIPTIVANLCSRFLDSCHGSTTSGLGTMAQFTHLEHFISARSTFTDCVNSDLGRLPLLPPMSKISESVLFLAARSHLLGCKTEETCPGSYLSRPSGGACRNDMQIRPPLITARLHILVGIMPAISCLSQRSKPVTAKSSHLEPGFASSPGGPTSRRLWWLTYLLHLGVYCPEVPLVSQHRPCTYVQTTSLWLHLHTVIS